MLRSSFLPPSLLDATTRLRAAQAAGKPYVALRVPVACAPETHDAAAQAAWTGSDQIRWSAVGCVHELTAGTPAEARRLPAIARAWLADNVDAEETLRPWLRFFGGIAFDPTRAAAWAGGAARFFLPELLGRDDETVWIAPVALGEAAIARRLEALLDAAPAPAAPAHWQGVRRAEPEAEARWHAAVNRALAAFAAGQLEKVVLARPIPLEFAAPPDAWAVYRGLSARAPQAHRFCFRFDGEAFLGASPELVFSQAGDRVYADCLAGTTARGATPAEDAALGAALFANDKERREHAAVVTMVRGVLGPLTETLGLPETPALRVLPNVQHLHTPVEGRLKADSDLTALLTGLHPTPAVCGTPREAAYAFIQEVEPFARGWYAGAIGWVGLNDAQFAVGIRSALLRENSALVYAGAGLVAGSQPAAEWAETERKAAPLVALLTGAPA